MTLKDLANKHGRTVASLGGTAAQIGCGAQKAGHRAIAKIARKLGERTTVVADACAASWAAGQARRANRSTAPAPATSTPAKVVGW